MAAPAIVWAGTHKTITWKIVSTLEQSSSIAEVGGGLPAPPARCVQSSSSADNYRSRTWIRIVMHDIIVHRTVRGLEFGKQGHITHGVINSSGYCRLCSLADRLAYTQFELT